MQITNAADRLAARLEAKARRPWNPDLHPRDSKGRFVETGGIARLWGGGMARVLRALGGRNVLVENLSTRERSTINASRLTMVARPDGSAPTRSKRKVRDEDERRRSDGRRGTGRSDDDSGDDGDTPDDAHDQDDEGNAIGEDRDGEDHGAGPEPEDDEPGDDGAAKQSRRRDPNRRFKTLDDVRAHWASGKLRQYNANKERQESHNKRMAGFMDELGKPQLSRNGHFVVGQMEVNGKTVWGITHSDTGVRFTTTERKAEALDFANRMENAHLDGQPLDWNSPDAFDRINTPEGRKMAGRIAAESKEAFAERAAKKRASATSRTRPAAPTTPEQRAAQEIADRTGAPEGNIAVGHVGAPAATAGDERGRPRNDTELRDFWKRGGAHAGARKEHRKSQADVLRRMANDPNLRIYLADHRGFAIVENTSRDDEYRFTVMTSGAGRRLSGLGPHRLMSYGNFADRDTADRFALYLGSSLRHEDGRTVDWGSPDVAAELNSFRDKDGKDSHIAIWRLAGQFDRERGVSDSMAARFSRPRDERDAEQRQDPQTTPEAPETGVPGEDETPLPAAGQQRDEQEEQQSERRVQATGEGVLGDLPPAGAGRAGGDEAAGDVLRADGRGDRGGDRGEEGRLQGGDRSRSGLQGRDGVDQHGDDEGQGSGPARDGVRPGEGAGDRGQGDAEGQPAEDRGRVAFGSSEEEQRAPQYQPPQDGRSLVPNGVLPRVKANIAAIEVLRRLEDENRPATAAEQETLARWSGWGATPQVFVDNPKPEFEPLQKRLRELLSDAEWDAAKENTLNAHYTDPEIIREVWKAVQELGFDGGNVLEPGSGSGNFIGYAPESAHMTGIELDPITAGISKALYPHADIRNEGFEKTRAADGTFDMAIGNVPFGDYQVVDLRHNKGGHNIHNAFILKSLDLTRPGGLVAVVTSRYTMDNATPRGEDARMEMARRADLVGAIRLPTGAHRRTAGTDVVTDLLIFRRREKNKEYTSGRMRNGRVKEPGERKRDDPPMWVHSSRVEDLPGQELDEDTNPNDAPKVHVNSYFLANPNSVLGEMAVGHGMYGPGELRVDGDGNLDASLGKALKKAVARAKDAGLSYVPDSDERRRPELLPEGSDRVDGHVQIAPDGTFTQVRDGMITPFDVPRPQVEEATQLLGLRDAMKTLVSEESRPDADEALIETLRGDLKARYDTYQAKFGAVNRFVWATRHATDPETGEQVKKTYRKRPQMGGLITKDPTMAVVLSLDTYDSDTGTSSPAAIFSKRQSRHRTIAERASSPEDAMAIVMEQHGTLDTDALAQVMGVTPDVARERMLAARSVDPETGHEYPLAFEPHSGSTLIPAADYLSGNVRKKLAEAQALAADDDRFDINVKQLEAVLPPEISSGEIDAPMGASWLGGDIVQAFLREKINTHLVRVSYQGGSLWKVDAPDAVRKSSAATEVWGTRSFDAIKLTEAILTNGRIRVTYKGDDSKTYVDEDATAAAQTKADEIREEFQDWLWSEPDRAERIKKLYNDTHNNLALRSYDGQRRTMPGLAEWFKPHAHQHSAVARMVNEPAVLLAHEVGAGKTAEMTMGVMELRRLGLINKAAIVVPNHMLQQFHDEFAELYPESATEGRILSASSEDLEGRKRREFIARVATGDYDAVILTQNAFESIPMRPEVQLDYIKREKEHLEEALRRQKQQDAEDKPGKRTDSRMVKEIQNRLKKLEAKITAKLAASKDTAGLYFEDTGIDYVVVDEAHHYKNLSTNSGIPGAAIEGSNRASDLDMKLEYLRKNTKSGRVVTFATATPISNSVTEAHTMLRYLRPDLLDEAKVRNFDEFASTYGKIVNGVELAADGSGFKEVSRFAAFRNMPELLRIWRTVADVKTSEDLAEYLDTPDVANNGKAITISVEPTEQMLAYQDELAARARAVKRGKVKPTEDNMLKISSDGRKVSLDPRMVGLDEQGHKLPRAAENIARIYEETKGAVYPTSKNNPTPHETPGGLQIVFLDMGTPKDPGAGKKKGKGQDAPTSIDELSDSPFPAYQELRELLIDQGVPAEKIRFIHEAKNDAEKARLFADARNGKIAVLVGSTAKMGTGTNVQLRATALHHLDCPWRPADLEQRNGRIIRQGNANPEVAIFQYVTEQSFDGFSWQTVARKAKFIRQIMKGNLTDRTVEDIPDGVFNAEQVTAISTGNPYLLEQANVKASLAILKRKLKGHLRTIEGYKSTIRSAERLRKSTDELVARLQDVVDRRKTTRGDAFNATIGKHDYTKRDEAAKALSTAAQAVLRQGMERPHRNDHPVVVVGRVGNIEVTAKYRLAWGDHGRLHLVDIGFPDISRSHHAYREEELKRDSTLPIQRLEDSLADIDKTIVRLESRLRQEERAAATARERVDRPFEQAKELDAAERRAKLVSALIREQGRQATSEDAGRDRIARLESLEHQLREARIAAGEDSGDVDDPAAAQDTDLLPRTPAPPAISTDEKGRPRVLWPDAEAKKEAKARQKREKQQQAREERGETTLDPEQVRHDLEGLREDTPTSDTTETETSEEGADAPAPDEEAPENSEETTTLDPAKVRSELDVLHESGFADTNESQADEEAPPIAEATDTAVRAADTNAPEPEKPAETARSTSGDRDRDDREPGPSRTSDQSNTTSRQTRPASERERRKPGTSIKVDRSAPAQPAPTALSDEQLADTIDELEGQLTPLSESTNPLDLALRRRLERRLWEHQEEERRRWKPEPEYDSNGNQVPRSRGSLITDRLGGYGTNDVESQGLVSRVEDLPEAKEGGYSDKEWERIDAAASANEAYPPTDEQNIIIQGAARRGLNMAVMALAGTGKSSTLKMLSHRMPGKKIIYLAFNRSVAAEAREAQTRGEYAKNMLASTANAYAARVADQRLNNRLPSNKAGGFKKLSAQQIADRMRWYDTVRAGGRDLSPGGAASVAERLIREWAKSADTEMGPQHIKAKTEDQRALFNAVKPLADRMWANLTDPEASDPDRDLPMDFDYIVKQWALGGYKLDADTLYWDEAQDVNPVMEGVVRAALDQGVQVVAVGDSNQAIYGFRGASDALAKLPVDARATLTQSFRFGPAVAEVGNRFLRLLGTRMRLKGFDLKESRIEQLQPGEESMVIARTNAGVALAAVQALTAGRTVAVSGGVKALQEFVQAAHALAAGEDTDHAELARFNGMPYDDILEDVKTDPDLQQLSSLFNLLEKHGDDIDALLSSGSRPAAAELVGDRVWVRLDWNDPKAGELKRWLGDGKNNGVGKLLYDSATRRYYYEPGKREVPWKSKTRSGVHKIDNKLSLEEAQKLIDAHLAALYPQDADNDGRGHLVPEHEPHEVLVTTAHKAKGLESERVRIADDFKGPEDDDNGSIDWDTVPDDEALRVAYVAVTRATEVLDPGSLGWVFRAVKDDDPTQPPKSEYRRDFELHDLQVGDQVDFQDEDGTPNTGTISEIDPPLLTVLSTSDEPGMGGKTQEISRRQVQRRNGEARPLLPVASDEELDRAITDGHYGSEGTVTLDPERVRNDLVDLNGGDTSSDTDEPDEEENTDAPPTPAADEDQAGPAPAQPSNAQPEPDLPTQDDQETRDTNTAKPAHEPQTNEGGSMSAEQLAEYTAANKGTQVSAEDEDRLFGPNSKDRITRLAAQTTQRHMGSGWVDHTWYRGRYVGSIRREGGKQGLWASRPAFGSTGPQFRTKAAALAYLALVHDANDGRRRDLTQIDATQQDAYRRLPDLAQHWLAEGVASYGRDGQERFQRLRDIREALADGRTVSGNVSDDLSGMADDARWLYENDPHPERRDDRLQESLGRIMHEVGEFLDTLDPESSAAGNHARDRDDAAAAYLASREDTGEKEVVSPDVLRNGDLVELSGLVEGYGAPSRTTERGYLIGAPIRTMVENRRQQLIRGWRVTVSEDPFLPPGIRANRKTFLIPEKNKGVRRFASAEETGLPTEDIVRKRRHPGESDIVPEAPEREGSVGDRDRQEDGGNRTDANRRSKRGGRDSDRPNDGDPDDRKTPDRTGEEENGDGGDNRRRRDRRRRDREGRDGGAPDGGFPPLPHGPDAGEEANRDEGDGTGAPGRLAELKDRYRDGGAPIPQGADPEKHAAYLRGLASNDTLALSPNGGLITWSDDNGHTWQFGHAISGMHLAGWEADGDRIGGRQGALRLADEYERLRDGNGNLINWAAPELDAQPLRAWRDGQGNPLDAAINQAREDSADAHGSQDERLESSADESAVGQVGRPAAPVEASSDEQVASGGADEHNPAAATSPEQEGDADSRYAINARHGTGERGGVVDGRRVPTPKEMEQFQSGGPNAPISEEGERALFGSPERMRELASDGYVPTPVRRSDHGGQVWRNGRLIGSLSGAQQNTDRPAPEQRWSSDLPFAGGGFSAVFRSREAAIAHLVLRDMERGEPDLTIVHPDLAWTLQNSGRNLGFPADDKLRGLEGLADNPADMERYQELRRLLDTLGRGVTPSGNVADDLDHLYDELRWLDATHYNHQPANLKDKYILGPGWLADEISEFLDVLRPEDPRAHHHDASQNRAAHQFIQGLLDSGGEDNGDRIPIADVRDGDVVHLHGRVTGLYAGATGSQLGYVIGEPKKVTFTANRKRQKGWRLTVSRDPFERTRIGLDTTTFVIPAEGSTALRLARAEDVELPFDQFRYGRQIFESPRTDESGDTHVAGRGGRPGSSEGELATGQAPEIDDTSSSQGSASAAAPAGPTTPAADVDGASAGSAADSEQGARRTHPQRAGGAGRRVDNRDSGTDTATEPPAAPEPVGGRPAEWVKVSDLQLGDLARVDGTTKGGSARTLAGYIVDGPKLIETTRNHRARNMYRILISDTPGGRNGKPVWVMPGAAAARAAHDDADQFQGSPQTGADSDVLTGRVAESVPTDRNGNGLFPGSVVTDGNGNDGVVTGASANSVRAQFGDSRTDDEHSPTSLSVTDGGAARPTGWTTDGHLVRTGNVVGDHDGNLLGTVEDVDGDTATVATLDGMDDRPIAGLRIMGDTEDTGGGHKIATVEPTNAGDVKEGDVLVRETPQGPRTARVTGRSGHGERADLDLEDTTTGESSQHSAPNDSKLLLVRDSDGNAPDIGPEDAPEDGGKITSHEPAPAVAPVTGPAVDPQLTPEERDAVTDRGQVATADPDAEQGTARITNDLPVTAAQASALADALREGSDPDTADGRVARRAADHLDTAAGNEPVGDGERPEPGTVGTVGVGDTITLPDEFAPDTMTAYRVVDIQDGPGGVRTLTVEDGDGQRFKRTLASADPLYQLPEPAAPADAPDAEPRDPNPAPDSDRLRADYRDSVVRAVIDSAIQGTTTPGSIHQLREQMAQQLTPEALRTAMRRARNGAIDAITNAGFDGNERDALVRSLRKEAATARTEAIRAAVRTLDDFEAHDGESEEETALRAADALRLIPEALRERLDADDNTGGAPHVTNAVTRHADDAVGEALQAAADGGPLTEERRAAIVAQLAARMAANRAAAAQQIAVNLPAGQRPGVIAHIIAGLVLIARKIVALVAAFLKALAKVWQRGREGLRRMRERIARFRRGLAQRVRTWPETRRLRRLAATTDLPGHADGLPLGDRVAHWARLLPAPGRFGQVSRRVRWYQPSNRSSLAGGQLPPVQDGVRWTMDRAVDGGPGPQALRHLAALRAAGHDVDTDVAARLTAAAPELGDDPHGTVRHASRYADTAEQRLRDLEAAAAGGAPDADLEIAAARVEAQSARQEAGRLQQAYTAALPEAVLNTLGGVREMGPGTTATLVTTPDSDPTAVRTLTSIAQYVPRDWLSPTEARFIGAREGIAGAYDPRSATATVADLGDGGRRTAAHALLVHLQQHYPDLLAAQEAFHFTRTHQGRVGARRHTSLDQLLARLFHNRTEQGDGGDLVPLGVAAMFSGDWYEDDDLRAFLLGLLATR